MNHVLSSVILSTAYMPPIEYIAQFLFFDNVFIEKEETYSKQTYRNRCCICGPNGLQILSIPVIKTFGNHTKTKDVKISYSTHWQLNHWRSLKTAYNASPYFLHYEEKLFSFYTKKYVFLLDYNFEILEIILKILKVKNKISMAEQYQQSILNVVDLREEIHPKKEKVNTTPRYSQVFEEKYGFISNLSIVDLLFNQGPETSKYLKVLI